MTSAYVSRTKRKPPTTLPRPSPHPTTTRSPISVQCSSTEQNPMHFRRWKPTSSSPKFWTPPAAPPPLAKPSNFHSRRNLAEMPPHRPFYGNELVWLGSDCVQPDRSVP